MRALRFALATCAVLAPLGLFTLPSCSNGTPTTPDSGKGDAASDATPDIRIDYDANVATWCEVPGSVVFDEGGKRVVGNVPGLWDLSWMTLPKGFCVHFYGRVNNARQIRFAPGGELFVASPTRGTTGGGGGGREAIVVLPDDDRNGLADSDQAFLSGISATQGILFTGGFFYWQDDTKIFRMPYAAGDRKPNGAPELMADINVFYSAIHWPKSMDVADDGTIYVANGSDQGESTADCSQTRPFRGGILALDPMQPGGRQVTKGFRNPIAVKCQRGKNNCFTTELTRDYSWNMGGREKLMPIRNGDDWGYPCCATKNLPYPDVQPTPDCSFVVPEDNAFYVADTPFGFDFEPGKWPAPWTNQIFLTLHGSFGTWVGARVVAIETDPVTGLPKNGGTLLPDGGQGNFGAIVDFVTGYDTGKLDHGRPADATFAPDGRLFLADDNLGVIAWIAPIGLAR